METNLPNFTPQEAVQHKEIARKVELEDIQGHYEDVYLDKSKSKNLNFLISKLSKEAVTTPKEASIRLFSDA